VNEIANGTFAFAGLLGFALVVALLAERVRIPAAVALVAIGALVGVIKPFPLPFAFGPTLLFVFLPPLIFEAAWNLAPGALRALARPILTLAVPGVLLTSFIIAAVMATAGVLPFELAFLLGAIVSATDPVAVIAVFRSMRVPAELATLVEAESLLNDGVAIALVSVALKLAVPEPGSSLAGEIAHATAGVVVATGIGIIAALLMGQVIRFAQTRAAELTGTIVLAYAAYTIAAGLDLSGVFATAAAGITLRGISSRVVTAQQPEEIDRFWDAIAYVFNAIAFLATGLVIRVDGIMREPFLVGVAIVAVFASRGLLAYFVLPLFPRMRALHGARTVTFVAGIRGGLALALALDLPLSVPHRAELVDAVFAIVFVTLALQGLAIEPVLRRLGYGGNWMGGPSPSS
jgi:CPA1 family monovalent cation:H+ antiporter